MAGSSNNTTVTENTTLTENMTEGNMDLQQLEIQHLKKKYTGQIRVISNLGDYTHVITVQPQDKNITIKFQLTGRYPQVIPTILVKSSEMDVEEIEALQDHLTEAATEAASTGGLILDLANNADKWLADHDLQLKGKCKSKPKKQDKWKHDKQKRKKRHEQIEDAEAEPEKKASMKTAEDVINRIQWDDKLPSDEFLVGYIDRFTGLQEKYFTAFSWEDIATVDYTVLAIPKHRIQYFKYKDEIIWDKNKRLDNVFGSLGSKMTVYDVIEKYEEEKEKKEELERLAKEDSNEDKHNDDSVDDSDSDSDDGITVTIGNASSAIKISESNDEKKVIISDDEDEDENYDKYWRDKMRPNHFLALRIHDDDIRKTAEHIQNVILEHEEQYQECCIPPKALHITLCTVGLDTPDQVAHAVQVIQKIKPELENIVPKDKPLVIKGVEQFFNRVLYAQVQCPPEFQKFVDHLKLCLKEEGIEIRDNHDFVPHMTIMKVTRPVARNTGQKYISPWLYSSQSGVEFGTQPVNNVYLCEMGISRQDDGFYITPTEIKW